MQQQTVTFVTFKHMYLKKIAMCEYYIHLKTGFCLRHLSRNKTIKNIKKTYSSFRRQI